MLANKEENRRRDVETLEAAGVPVFVTYARTRARSGRRRCARSAASAPARAAAEAIAAEVEEALAAVAARRAGASATRVVALVWRDPFMAVGGDTFANDLLECCGGAQSRSPTAGGEPLPAARAARARSRRSPTSSCCRRSPTRFGERDRDELLALDCPAARAGRVHVIEGELLSWYGPRMARALRTIAELLLPGG